MRATIIAAIVAFVLGLLLGILAGNSVLIVLGRALLSAALSAAGVYGISSLIKKVFPELMPDASPRSDLADLGAAEGLAQNVDIVVSDEEGSQIDAEESSGGSNLFDQGRGLESIVEEVVEESIDARAQTEYAAEPEFNEESFYLGVENLPDIAGFESSFGSGLNHSTEEAGDSGELDEDIPARGPRSSGSGNNEGMDPKLIARAISTALKKG